MSVAYGVGDDRIGHTCINPNNEEENLRKCFMESLVNVVSVKTKMKLNKCNSKQHHACRGWRWWWNTAESLNLFQFDNMSCAIHTQTVCHEESLNTTHRQTYKHATTTDEQRWSKQNQIIQPPSYWNKTGPCWKERAGKGTHLISCRTGSNLEKDSLVRELDLTQAYQWSVDFSHSWHGAFISPSQHVAFISCD